MSPLPESRPEGDVYFGSEENIRNFFSGNINPDEIRKWHAFTAGVEELMILFENKQVNFKHFVERYNENGDGGVVFHTVFSTPQLGVYLDFVSDKRPSLDNPKGMIEHCKDVIFFRFGENANREYIESITTH